jgi:hypothetical protein
MMAARLNSSIASTNVMGDDDDDDDDDILDDDVGW